MGPAETSDSRADAIGEQLGPYRLEEKLGEGRMGVVYKAVRDTDGETVALKVLKKELSGDDVYRKRFRHEARAASEVRNKHLARILDSGEVEGHHYLAVSYVGGRSLEERIKSNGALPLGELCRLVAGVAAGLDALHADGLIHRDVKPSNIILDTEGRAIVTDFGLAKGRAYTALTKPGQVLGSLDYLAPELIKGLPASPASDIYALGCTAFECAVGAPPFASKSIFEVTVAHLEEEPPDPRETRADLPPTLPWALLQALEKDPARRPPTATAYGHIIRAACSPGTR